MDLDPGILFSHVKSSIQRDLSGRDPKGGHKKKRKMLTEKQQEDKSYPFPLEIIFSMKVSHGIHKKLHLFSTIDPAYFSNKPH